ncbi:MAG TPA: sialidase family protein [Bryobacteraceae bacterium]|nr:sialidase family protein [Bryobacteraceae bacterium]
MKTSFLAASLLCCAFGQQAPQVIEHVTVYKEAGRYGGWPANHGIWSWGNEIVVGFEIGYFKDNPTGHDIDYAKPVEHALGRSLDGGKTWTVTKPEGLRPPSGSKVADLATIAGAGLKDCPGGLDFTHPDFAISFRMTSVHDGVSRYHYSYDRGKTWEGACRLPNLGQPGIAARTDYIVNGKHDMLLFVAAAKSNRREGRVLAARTQDGGKTWNMLSFIGPEPPDYAIMPSTVRVGPSDLVSAIRRRRWIDIYRSTNNGESWSFVNQPMIDNGSNPPSMVRLDDGRLVLTYGYRIAPFGIRAKISKDNGNTWGEEIVLRQDGGGGDLGYPRTVKRPDGKLITVYYFNEDAGKERYIAGTIWDPGK